VNEERQREVRVKIMRKRKPKYLEKFEGKQHHGRLPGEEYKCGRGKQECSQMKIGSLKRKERIM